MFELQPRRRAPLFVVLLTTALAALLVTTSVAFADHEPGHVDDGVAPVEAGTAPPVGIDGTAPDDAGAPAPDPGVDVDRPVSPLATAAGSDDPPVVLGAYDVPVFVPGSGDVPAGDLPFTGAAMTFIAFLGGALLVAGGSLYLLGARRARARDPR